MSADKKMTIEEAAQKGLLSADVAQEKRDALKQLFPEVFTEDTIDFEQLRRVMGDWVEPGKERYGLNWPGKAECMKVIQAPSIATLKPARDESVNFDETENLFIEGDNLEVLKLLQKAYFGNVKMIYIDPPYNTGGDFIYPDKYSESLETYLLYTGQIDNERKKFSTDTDAAGRHHSRWISMMYPRLYLARNLLRDDGVIAISIDDNELLNLRATCDQIFGAENFLNCVSVKMSEASGVKMSHVSTRLPKLKEYVLIYRKSESVKLNPITVKAEKWNEEYKSYLEGISRQSADKIKELISLDQATENDAEEVDQLLSDANIITCDEAFAQYEGDADFEDWRWENSWRIIQAVGSSSVKKLALSASKSKDQHIRSLVSTTGKLYLYKTDFNENTKSPRIQVIFADLNIDQKLGDFWADIKTTGAIGQEGGIIFPNGKKPQRLLRRLLQIFTQPNSNDVVLDFFAGSGSMGQSILDQNVEDAGDRRFILAQLPEKIDEDNELSALGYDTVSEVTSARLKNVINDNDTGGFRKFVLDQSNFRIWDGDVEKAEDLAKQLELHVDHIDQESSPEDILYELLLKAGFELTTKVEKQTMAGKDVYAVSDGAMLICLDKELTPELIDALADANPLQVICLDEGFKGKDQLKTNAVQTFKSRAKEDEEPIVFRTV